MGAGGRRFNPGHPDHSLAARRPPPRRLALTTIDQQTRRRTTRLGLTALDEDRACPGYVLFTPNFGSGRAATHRPAGQHRSQVANAVSAGVLGLPAAQRQSILRRQGNGRWPAAVPILGNPERRRDARSRLAGQRVVGAQGPHAPPRRAAHGVRRRNLSRTLPRAHRVRGTSEGRNTSGRPTTKCGLMRLWKWTRLEIECGRGAPTSILMWKQRSLR